MPAGAGRLAHALLQWNHRGFGAGAPWPRSRCHL